MALSFDDKRAVLKRWFAAYNARDISGMCRLAHPSITITPTRPLMDSLPGTAFHGEVGVRSLMRWTFENFPRVFAKHLGAEDAGAWTLDETEFIADVEAATPHRSTVWSLFEIEAEGIRKITSYRYAEQAREALRHISTLTPREREVFGLLARGLTATEIAEALVLSPLTVRTHIQNGKDRLGARTRMQALSIALRRGEINA